MPLLTPPLHNTKELFLKISESDEGAFQTLVGIYKPKLYSYAFRILKSHEEAEELVQETFIKLWLKRETLITVENPEQYVFRIIRNLSIDHLRKIALDARLRQNVWQSIQKSANCTEELVLANESDHLVKDAIGKLSAHKQVIFRLSRYDGLNHDEIASRLRISPNTVKNQLVSSLRFIREYLASHLIAVLIFLSLPGK